MSNNRQQNSAVLAISRNHQNRHHTSRHFKRFGYHPSNLGVGDIELGGCIIRTVLKYMHLEFNDLKTIEI